MRSCTTYFLAATFMLSAAESNAQNTSSVDGTNDTKSHSNEFFISAGYNYCKFNFFDAGIRYYRWKNDAQTVLSFGGVAAGCEFSIAQEERLAIPYIGWQGQRTMLAYGLRAEYAISPDKQAFSLTPEMGLSLFEFFRITGGYRIRFDQSDALGLNDFRFSVIVAFPIDL